MSLTVDEQQTGAASAAVLTQVVLDAEAERTAARAIADVPETISALPGVGDEEMSLSEAFHRWGISTFAVLALLNSLDELEGAALSVLAPEIRDTFGMSDGAIVFISTAAAAFVVLGTLPMGWMADRYRRPRIIGWASMFFAAMVCCTGLVVNAFQLFWVRLGVGIGKSNTLPVHGSLLADTYPIGVRGRLFGITTGAGTIVGTASPLIVGGIAALAGGDEGWRWAFLLLGLPVVPLAVLAFRLPEPQRGQHEMLDVLGEVIVDPDTAPISIEAGFARLLRIRTVKTVLVAFSAIGFGLFTAPVLASLYVEDRFGLDALDRGLLGTFGGLGVLVVLPFATRYYDRLYRRDPSAALRIVGFLIIPVAALVPLQYLMPSAVAFAVVGVPVTALTATAFTMVQPVMQSVVPYRLRGIGGALAAIYIFFIGATGGALISALLADAVGPGTAAQIVTVPACLLGGLLILRSATFINGDLAAVAAELEEEREEAQRGQAEPGRTPAVQVRGIDFHYGSVQVLFDVGFEVQRGEVLALLGTNGAGKSTILRIIAGLGTPTRGVVRFDGRTVTFVPPERRAGYGVHLLQGGRGTFPDLTVRENLEVGAFRYRADRPDRDSRVVEALDLFSDLAGRQDQLARSLSGGQQQMLALAITLLHEPEVLLIDELSLGLSPIVVEELLQLVQRLRDRGTTMIVVEQSLNVALTIADRAVFLEKGQVRFEGPAAELRERDDLARAVFLGPDGG